MPRDLVSVVIPTFNRAHVLPTAVESVLRQTHADTEVLVADDGSTDGTEGLVAERWGGERRVVYLRQRNRGVSAARNLGLGAARGDYVALLDSDDCWFDWKLELQLACLREFPEAVMVWSDMDAHGPDGRLLATRYLRRMYSAWGAYDVDTLFPQSRPLSAVVPRLAARVGTARVHAGDIFSPMMTGSLVHTSTVLLRRSTLDRVGGFDEGLALAGEDYDFHLRTCLQGPVAFVDLPTIRYLRGSSDQLSRPEHSIHIARNFLTTVTRMARQEADRISLPPGRLDAVISEAHAWIASASLRLGDNATARRQYLLALRRRPASPRLLPRLALSFVPSSLLAGSRRLYRRLWSRRVGSSPGGRSDRVVGAGESA